MTGQALTLAAKLQAGAIMHLNARISHVRTGPMRHAFRYKSDYVLFAPEVADGNHGLLRRNRFGLFSLYDRDHGPLQERRGAGGQAAWVRAAFEGAFTPTQGAVLGLMTQPRWLGLGFNPVSFWLLWREGQLIAYLAEVNNTFGQRHFYICRPDPQVTDASSKTCAKAQVEKVFHVSPFQDVAGRYHFRLSLDLDALDLLICHDGPKSGLVARMQGRMQPLRQGALLKAAFARPGGALRILGLIYFEALRLKLRGAAYRPLPAAPVSELSE